MTRFYKLVNTIRSMRLILKRKNRFLKQIKSNTLSK
jgi:hypothetical protein